MSTHANRVQMTVSGTPGTGTITLNAASSGYRSFATAYGANATVDVLITEGTAWEVARDCTYTHSGTTLGRGTLENSSTGSAVSFTSAAVVSVIATAHWGNRAEGALQAVTPGGRLTLESGVPVSATDQTAKTTIYYTPYVHNTINLWDGFNWAPTVFAETSEALGTLTSGLPYDVFGFLSSGVLDLEKLAWTNGTTRATAVTLQDGRYCKSGDKTRLYLGTFYTTATTTTEDSDTKRFVWNMYNRTPRRLRLGEATGNWSYTTATWRSANNSTANRLQVICGQPTLVDILLSVLISPSTGGAGEVSIAEDSTSTPSSEIISSSFGSAVATIYFSTNARLVKTAAVGFHYYQWLERTDSGTTTVYGDDATNATYRGGMAGAIQS